MKVSRKKFLLPVLLICAVVAVGWACMRGGMESYEGYFAPVYSPDGQYVYFVERQTRGDARVTDVGGFFSDAKYDVFVAKDTFTLNRLNLATGRVEELVRLAPSPLEGRRYEARGHPFESAEARLRFTKEKQLEFGVCLTAYQMPVAKNYWSSGVWVEPQRAAMDLRSWQDSYCQTGGFDESTISGDWEVMQVNGGRHWFPVAIVAFNHITRNVKVLLKSNDYDRAYPTGVAVTELEKNSRRALIEHHQKVNRTYEALMQQYKAQGMSDIEAELQTGKEMERLGYYPKSTKIVARRLSSAEAAKIDKAALFTIVKPEMASGIFPDIEKAIASPGEEIDQDGEYHIHRDYSNSARLNAFLSSGKTQFYVRYLDQTYELTIKKPPPFNPP